MRVALVHDFLSEYGGAERVLETLCEIFPKAPIYTAFYKEGSPAYLRFKAKKIITSWAQNMPFFVSKLHSPLRFLAPLIWNSFDFSQYDLVVTSSSWYMTKGVVKRVRETESERVKDFMRVYDFEAAQRVDYFIANSKEVAARIKKFYRRDSFVIYPPVDIKKLQTPNSKFQTDGNYFL